MGIPPNHPAIGVPGYPHLWKPPLRYTHSMYVSVPGWPLVDHQAASEPALFGWREHWSWTGRASRQIWLLQSNICWIEATINGGIMKYIYIYVYIHIIMTVIIYIYVYIHIYIHIIKHMGIPPFFQWLPHEMFPIMRILWGYSICNEKTWFDNPPASPKAGWKWGFSDGLNGDLMIIGQPVWWFMVSKEWHLFRKRKLEIMSPVLQVYFCGTDWWMVA